MYTGSGIMRVMTIYFKEQTDIRQPSTLAKSLDGHIRFLTGTCNGKTFSILADDNDGSPVEVYVVHKRKLQVITDRVMKARLDEQAEKLPSRLSGLQLNLYAV